MKQLSIDLRVQDEMDFDGEISRIITETAQSRIKEGTLARSKHEAYGIAAENLAQVCSTVKVLKSDTGNLLNVLPQETTGSRVVEQISSIYGTAQRLAKESVILASLCRRMIDDMYNIDAEEILPLEELADFNDAEFEDTDDIEESEE